jgi:hypothetical protein
MSRTDLYRWRNLRPLNTAYVCRCGAMFEPEIHGQRLCLACVAEERSNERQAFAEQEATLKRSATQAEEQRVKGRRSEQAPSMSTRMSRSLVAKDAEELNAERERTKQPRTSHKGPRSHRRGAGARTAPKTWAHIAVRKKREGWTTRHIAKWLGRPLAEVEEALRNAP